MGEAGQAGLDHEPAGKADERVDAREAGKVAWRARLAQAGSDYDITIPEGFGLHLGMWAVLNFLAEDRFGGGMAAQEAKKALAEKLGLDRERPNMEPLMPHVNNRLDSIKPDDLGPAFDALESLANRENPTEGSVDPLAIDRERALAMGFREGGQRNAEWQSMARQFQDAYNAESKKEQQQRNTMTMAPAMAMRRSAQAEPEEPTDALAIEPESSEHGPLAVDRYSSVAQLERDLSDMGPTKETYDKVMGYVDKDRQDDAKSVLSKFFQGMAGAGAYLYDMLVDVGMASPLDQEILEGLMEEHPNLMDGEQPDVEASCEGLILPPPGTSLNTMEKTASGFVGGPSPAYYTHGPGEQRFCPKLRNVLNTYVCRYHCLDGLPIDDHQILCGEAIWRQAVMDKFSRPYRDRDGNWVGGYLNKRFEIERSTHEHPYQLKPGQRRAPINEDAWSTEKRMQEMRREKSAERGYASTPGDPHGLYSWDPHEDARGPKNPNLCGKDKEPISKMASNDKRGRNAGSLVTRVASMWPDGVTTSKKKYKAVNPWAICTKSVGREDEDKYERCVRDVKKKHKIRRDKSSSQGKLVDDEVKAAKSESNPWSLESSIKRGSNMGDPMMDHVDVGYVGQQCPSCGKKFRGERVAGKGPPPTNCDNCGSKLVPLSKREQVQETGGIEAVDLPISAMLGTTIREACGVFRASRNGTRAYGTTPREAQSKLDKMLAESEPGSVQEESMRLLKERQKEEKDEPEERPEVPSGGIIDTTPSTPEVPLSQAPTEPSEIQDGESLLAPEENGQVDKNSAMGNPSFEDERDQRELDDELSQYGGITEENSVKM